jgi:hypothetical protein
MMMMIRWYDDDKVMMTRYYHSGVFL